MILLDSSNGHLQSCSDSKEKKLNSYFFDTCHGPRRQKYSSPC